MRKKHQMWFDLIMVVFCMVGIGVIAYISHRIHTPPPSPSQQQETTYGINEAREKLQELKAMRENTVLNYEDSI